MMSGKLGDKPMMDYVVTWTGLESDGESRRYLYDVVSATSAGSAGPDEIEDLIMRAHQGIAGQAVGSATGLARVQQTRGSAGVTPSIGWLIHAIAVTLPTEAVGVGAVWTQTSRDKQETTTTEARYTLVQNQALERKS